MHDTASADSGDTQSQDTAPDDTAGENTVPGDTAGVDTGDSDSGYQGSPAARLFDCPDPTTAPQPVTKDDVLAQEEDVREFRRAVWEAAMAWAADCYEICEVPEGETACEVSRECALAGGGEVAVSYSASIIPETEWFGEDEIRRSLEVAPPPGAESWNRIFISQVDGSYYVPDDNWSNESIEIVIEGALSDEVPVDTSTYADLRSGWTDVEPHEVSSAVWRTNDCQLTYHCTGDECYLQVAEGPF